MQCNGDILQFSGLNTTAAKLFKHRKSAICACEPEDELYVCFGKENGGSWEDWATQVGS